MPTWPAEHGDTVLYEEREIIANNDIVVRTIDGSSVLFYGDMYLNDEKVAGSSPTTFVRNFVKKNETDPLDVTAGIRDAITAAGVNGTLIFDPREYQLQGSGTYQALLSPLSGQTWIGNGARLNTQSTYEGPMTIRIDSVNNVNISGFHITCPNVTAAVGIMLEQCDSISIESNRFTDPKSGGVHAKGDVVNVRIANNTFFGVGYGILMNDEQVAEITGSYNWTIANNVFDGQNGVGDGIQVNRPLTAAKGISITGNVIRNYAKTTENVGFGISVANCSDVTISDNRVDNCARNGVHIEDGSTLNVSITGNVISNCHHAGIEVQISNAVGSPTCVSIIGNTVRGCCITPTVNLGQGGIEANFYTGDVASTSAIVIASNVSSANNTGAGIYVYQSHRSVISGNICTNSNGNVGLFLTSCQSSTIIGNVCSDTRGVGFKTQTYGIKYNGVGTNTILALNEFDGNLTAYRDLSGAVQDWAVIDSTTTGEIRIGNSISKLGFFGTAGIVKPAVAAAATDPATTQTLVNNIRAALIGLGLVS